ncbi:c3hc zinc finger protein [Emericellopsis cladophorae]|uniref:C3hc zinc finger protein n=1 Tax=Emericellopsis cladophorae TaxID=2686198 RepID=A0A9P9Y4X2_9HYPO|nr:c3hc zinc finger protein [Emericellopsis cladophorae]KAI6783609.1 c3hc zinc finger protein [Emericellopsis cladophorae]
MNNTKRKFNSLLQGLSAPKPSPATDKPRQPRTTAEVEELLQKRRRLGVPQSNGTSLSTKPTTARSTITSPGRRQEVKEEKPAARFNPSDRGELLKRLATFHDITDWTPKPERLSEIEWAKRGWVCHGKETVRCLLCNKELVVKLKKEANAKEAMQPTSAEVEKALVDKQPPTTAARERYSIVAGTQGKGLSNPRMGAVPNSASCHTCLRRLGLWMFKSKEINLETNEVILPAPMDHLDPIREHRFFCPWKNAEIQKRQYSKLAEQEAQPGWRVLLQTLDNDAQLRSMYEGKPRSRPQSTVDIPHTPSKGPPRTPGPATPATHSGLPLTPATVATQGVEDEEKVQEAKDKERWARLKRVKSLFDLRGARKRGKSASRPGTSNSTRTTGGDVADATT